MQTVQSNDCTVFLFHAVLFPAGLSPLFRTLVYEKHTYLFDPYPFSPFFRSKSLSIMVYLYSCAKYG